MVVLLVILSCVLMMGITWYLKERKKKTSTEPQVAGFSREPKVASFCMEPTFAQDGGEPLDDNKQSQNDPSS